MEIVSKPLRRPNISLTRIFGPRKTIRFWPRGNAKRSRTPALGKHTPAFVSSLWETRSAHAHAPIQARTISATRFPCGASTASLCVHTRNPITCAKIRLHPFTPLLSMAPTCRHLHIHTHTQTRSLTHTHLHTGEDYRGKKVPMWNINGKLVCPHPVSYTHLRAHET